MVKTKFCAIKWFCRVMRSDSLFLRIWLLSFFQLVIIFAFLAVAFAEEQAAGETKKDKRGIYGLGYGGGSYGGYSGGYGGGYGGGVSVGQVSVLTREVPVPVPHPVAVPVERQVPVPVRVKICISLVHSLATSRI